MIAFSDLGTENYDPERPGHLLSSAVPNYLSQPCDCISSCPMACTGQASTSRTLKEIKFKSVNSDAPSTGITQFKAKENLLSNQSLHKGSVVKVTDPTIPSTITAFLKMIPSSSSDPAMIHSKLSHEESMLPVTDLAEAVINTTPMKIIPSSSPDLVSAFGRSFSQTYMLPIMSTPQPTSSMIGPVPPHNSSNYDKDIVNQTTVKSHRKNISIKNMKSLLAVVKKYTPQTEIENIIECNFSDICKYFKKRPTNPQGIRYSDEDIEVRWNSTFLMLERLLEQKSAVNLYSVEHGKIETLTSDEWDLIKHLTKVLKFFYEATLELSFDNACISIVIPLISMLNRKLQTQSENEAEACINMKHALLESLNNRFSFVKGHPLLMAATLLDPRFKSKYISTDEVNIATNEIVNFLARYSKNTHREQENDINATLFSESQNIHSQIESLWDTHDQSNIEQMHTDENLDPTATLRQTLQCYLSEPLLQRNADIYSYWNSSPYPLLRNAVLKYLSAPPTSVPSEQLFSAAGQIYADRRGNLLGENAEKLLFLAYNIRLFNFDY
ncbi:hypothetical protein evm_013553 [Chilo suppressalis]|nr:hypothetical protein evm_013553 [Chilo suppressalis]